MNYFGEKHGKNARDTHFSCLSLFLKMESLVTPLKTSDDIVNAIIKRQAISNTNRALRCLKPINTICFALDSEDEMDRRNLECLSIKGIETLYNYRTIGPSFILVSSILSDENKGIAVEIEGNQIIFMQRIFQESLLLF